MFLKIPRKADMAYYSQLEQGARYLAGEAACAAERAEHLGKANLYARLGRDVAAEKVCPA